MFAHEELRKALERAVETRDLFRNAIRKVPDAEGLANRMNPIIADTQRLYEEITDASS